MNKKATPDTIPGLKSGIDDQRRTKSTEQLGLDAFGGKVKGLAEMHEILDDFLRDNPTSRERWEEYQGTVIPAETTNPNSSTHITFDLEELYHATPEFTEETETDQHFNNRSFANRAKFSFTAVQRLSEDGNVPKAVIGKLNKLYEILRQKYGQDTTIFLRSSCTDEDTSMTVAGQYKTIRISLATTMDDFSVCLYNLLKCIGHSVTDRQTRINLIASPEIPDTEVIANVVTASPYTPDTTEVFLTTYKGETSLSGIEKAGAGFDYLRIYRRKNRMVEKARMLSDLTPGQLAFSAHKPNTDAFSSYHHFLAWHNNEDTAPTIELYKSALFEEIVPAMIAQAENRLLKLSEAYTSKLKKRCKTLYIQTITKDISLDQAHTEIIKIFRDLIEQITENTSINWLIREGDLELTEMEKARGIVDSWLPASDDDITADQIPTMPFEQGLTGELVFSNKYKHSDLRDQLQGLKHLSHFRNLLNSGPLEHRLIMPSYDLALDFGLGADLEIEEEPIDEEKIDRKHSTDKLTLLKVAPDPKAPVEDPSNLGYYDYQLSLTTQISLQLKQIYTALLRSRELTKARESSSFTECTKISSHIRNTLAHAIFTPHETASMSGNGVKHNPRWASRDLEIAITKSGKLIPTQCKPTQRDRVVTRQIVEAKRSNANLKLVETRAKPLNPNKITLPNPADPSNKWIAVSYANSVTKGFEHSLGNGKDDTPKHKLTDRHFTQQIRSSSHGTIYTTKEHSGPPVIEGNFLCSIAKTIQNELPTVSLRVISDGKLGGLYVQKDDLPKVIELFKAAV